MPDHEALRINARPARQHDHKDHILLAHVQIRVLHAVVARAVERGNGPVTDAGFGQFIGDLGQLPQILRAG